MFRYLFVFLLVAFLAPPVAAKVAVHKYGVVVPYDSLQSSMKARVQLDSILRSHPQMSLQYGVSAIMKYKRFNDTSYHFYYLCGLLLFLGVIRFSNEKYFRQLFSVFMNPSRSGRGLQEQLQATKLSNFLMNLFFTASAGTYIYYLVGVFKPRPLGNISPMVLLGGLIAGMMLIYLGKYAVIRFSGWAFRLEGITDFYLFNVFLINKIVAICLLPFTLLLAFGDPVYAPSLVLGSFAVLAVLFINRYTRSWQVFGSFFQFSKFHFFMYLCASELLPLAVLMKILVRGVLYY